MSRIQICERTQLTFRRSCFLKRTKMGSCRLGCISMLGYCWFLQWFSLLGLRRTSSDSCNKRQIWIPDFQRVVSFWKRYASSLQPYLKLAFYPCRHLTHSAGSCHIMLIRSKLGLKTVIKLHDACVIKALMLSSALNHLIYEMQRLLVYCYYLIINYFLTSCIKAWKIAYAQHSTTKTVHN